MKTYKHLFEQVVDPNNLYNAIINASKGKRKRYDIHNVLNNKWKYVDKLHELLVNDKWVPHAINTSVIYSNDNSRKTRIIHKPNFIYDQIVQHAVIQVLSPIITKKVPLCSYGSLPKRGMHKAISIVSNWINISDKHTHRNINRYVLSFDIHHFYGSIDLNILFLKLSSIIKDKRFLSLLHKLLFDLGITGLPLGYYTSQWFAMFYLSEFDHMIKEKYHQKYYIRYMDDILILGSNKRKLHILFNELRNYLSDSLNLSVKSNYQVYALSYYKRFDKLIIYKKHNEKNSKNIHSIIKELHIKRYGRPLTYLGFRFDRFNSIKLKKIVMLRLTRKITKVKSKGRSNISVDDARSLLSMVGLLKVVTCDRLLKVRYNKYFGKNGIYLRNIVSKSDKLLINTKISNMKE